MLFRKELELIGYVIWEVFNNEKIIVIIFDDGLDLMYIL